MKLIVGGDSFIGNNLSNYWNSRGVEHQLTTRRESGLSKKSIYCNLQLKQPVKIRSAFSSSIICTSISNMEQCEENKVNTRKINVRGVKNLIKILSNNKIHIVFLSSNAVFDGKKPYVESTDKHCPINEYGQQKAEIEKFILEKIPNASILRLTKIIHQEMKLLTGWSKKLKNNQKIYAFSDLTFSPISLEKVLHKISLLSKKKLRGIYQLSGKKDITYYEYARNFAEKNGYPKESVIEESCINRLNYKVPAFTSLINI